MVSFSGDEFKKARNRLGLTHNELAELSGVSRRTIQNIEKDVPTVSPQSKRKVAVTLKMIADSDQAAYEQHADAFRRLPGLLFEHVARFSKRKGPDATRVPSMHEAEKIVRRMRENWKLHLEQVCDLKRNSRLRKIDVLLDERCDEYVDRYVQIWHRSRESLMCAVSKNEQTGGSIVLPVTDEAYEAFVAGERPYMDIRNGDILPQSQNLIYDSMVEFLDAPQRSWFDITNSLSATVMYQSVALSKDVTADNFRIASFEASPANAKRLKSVGFRRNGRHTKQYEFPIYEFASNPTISPTIRSKRNGPNNNDDAQLTSRFLGDLMRQKFLKSDSRNLGMRIRRRTVLVALSLLQRLVKVKAATYNQRHRVA